MTWYDAHARDLPWRRPGTTPWEVLVSEVMSQQTPVARVVPAWQEWMRRWPGPAELAQAPTAAVLRVWGRLGYPRRALRLIECARSVVEQHGGVLPDDLDALLALPGVGEYTAGAVLAFAHGRRALVLDTNVRRVLARAVGGQALPAPSLNRAERERALVGGRHGARRPGVHRPRAGLRGLPVADRLRLAGGRPPRGPPRGPTSHPGLARY